MNNLCVVIWRGGRTNVPHQHSSITQCTWNHNHPEWIHTCCTKTLTTILWSNWFMCYLMILVQLQRLYRVKWNWEMRWQRYDQLEEPSVLGCQAVLLGERFMVFQKNVLPPSSRSISPRRYSPSICLKLHTHMTEDYLQLHCCLNPNFDESEPFLTFICPCIASISLKYNQQDAMFSWSIYFYELLHVFRAVPPPIMGSTKLYIQRQVLSKQYCCLLLSWMRWNLEFHLIHDSSRQQYWFDNTWRRMYSFVLLMMGGGTAWNM